MAAERVRPLVRFFDKPLFPEPPEKDPEKDEELSLRCEPPRFPLLRGALVLLLATATLASLVPSYRAIRVDPVRAINVE